MYCSFVPEKSLTICITLKSVFKDNSVFKKQFKIKSIKLLSSIKVYRWKTYDVHVVIFCQYTNCIENNEI